MKQDSLIVHRALDAIHTYRKEILFSLGTIVLTVGGYFGFRAWRSYQNEAAHRTYEACMVVYKTPVSGGAPQEGVEFAFASEQEKWSQLRKLFLDGYAQHSSSGFSGLFLAYAAEAHDALGDKAQAIDTLEKAVSSFGDRVMKGWYHAKLGLAYLDSDDQSVVDRGLKILIRCAQDQKHIANDLALYQLGNYHWFRGEYDQARSYWNTLEINYRKADKPSEWYLQAKQKLKLVQG